MNNLLGRLEFTSGPVVGKTMIVQSTNTGIDLGSNQFDILIPGGGAGAFQNGCTKQFGQPFPGEPDGGVSSRATCGELPTQSLRNGCYWRFDWFEGANNPNVNFTQHQDLHYQIDEHTSDDLEVKDDFEVL
ncbi:Endoglucanase-5 [Cytospora mali]|uniref:cellulase n=1 Tax=Cytospora mali TaxID=578113 RepID=A0A194VBI1_CYTMA|nr:Endoglucanase-5 [Valsa mali var. pyri (nom. inval.)]